MQEFCSPCRRDSHGDVKQFSQSSSRLCHLSKYQDIRDPPQVVCRGGPIGGPRWTTAHLKPDPPRPHPAPLVSSYLQASNIWTVDRHVDADVALSDQNLAIASTRRGLKPARRPPQGQLHPPMLNFISMYRIVYQITIKLYIHQLIVLAHSI